MIIAALATAAGLFQAAPCALEGVPAGFERLHDVECGWVTVPLRPGVADGKTIRLWTARIKASGSSISEEPILYINGGPGIATVDSIVPELDGWTTMAMLRNGRDVIVFDQRGSGRSEEALCPELAGRLNAVEREGLSPAVEEERGREEFRACREQLIASGADLESYTTASTVADMEVIRRAFGVSRWNLLSISYGSLVALHAMRTNPSTIRSVILNSPYPPNTVTWAEQASSAAAAYTSIDRACSEQPACRERFGHILPKLEEVLARLERAPVMDGESVINGRRFAEALWPVAVRSSTVRFIPLIIERAHAGDEDVIRKMAAKYAGAESFGGFSPAQAMAISCHEGGRTHKWFARARRLYPGLVSPAPDDSWDRLCSMYRPGFADASFFAPVASGIPTLIYAGTLDPATPVIDAYQAMRFLDVATLIEVEGAAHGPMGIDDCTRGIAAAFLAAPDVQPDHGCIATRTRMAFALDGLEELLTPPSE